jgi:hypothetical protein
MSKSNIENTVFRGTEQDMRGGVPVFPGSEQYGGLVVPSGLSVETNYAPKQLQYVSTDSMMGGGYTGNDVIPEHLHDKLFGSIEKTRYITNKTKRSTK